MHDERIVLSEKMLSVAVGDRWSSAEVSTVAAMLADGEGKFPPGTRTVSSELVKAVQRERLIAAMLRAVARIGYRDVSVQDVLDRAAVSRPTFYEHFANKEDCFIAAFDAAAGRLEDALILAVEEAPERWRDRIGAAIERALRFVGEDSDAARTLIVESRASTPAGLKRREALLNRLAIWMEGGVEAGEAAPPSIAAAGIVGGIESMIYVRINREETDALGELLPSLLYFAVAPFEGRPAAAAAVEGAGS